MKRIQSKNHKLRTYKTNETISSSYFDGERYALHDGIKTLSYIHKNSS